MPQTQASSSSDIQSFLDSNGGVAIVQCYGNNTASRCYAPKVQQSANRYNVPLVRVNVDSCYDLASSLGISAMPTLLLIKTSWNNVVQKNVGAGGNVDQFISNARY